MGSRSFRGPMMTGRAPESALTYWVRGQGDRIGRGPVWERYGALTIFSMTTPCVGTLVAVYESLEVPRSFCA